MVWGCLILGGRDHNHCRGYIPTFDSCSHGSTHSKSQLHPPIGWIALYKTKKLLKNRMKSLLHTSHWIPFKSHKIPCHSHEMPENPMKFSWNQHLWSPRLPRERKSQVLPWTFRPSLDSRPRPCTEAQAVLAAEFSPWPWKDPRSHHRMARFLCASKHWFLFQTRSMLHDSVP